MIIFLRSIVAASKALQNGDGWTHNVGLKNLQCWEDNAIYGENMAQ